MLQHITTWFGATEDSEQEPIPADRILDLDVWGLAEAYDRVALNPAGAALEYAAGIEYLNDLTVETAWLECGADFEEWVRDRDAVQTDLAATYAAQQHMLGGGGLFAQALGGAA